MGVIGGDHLTRRYRQDLIALLAMAVALGAARWAPILNETPGAVVLAAVMIIALTMRRRPALLAMALAGLGLAVIRPAASVQAEVVRSVLLFLLGGAVAAIMYGRQRTLEATVRFRQIFEQNPLPMWVYDEETLKFLAVNQAAIEKYGYSRTEFESLTLRDIRPEEDLPAFELRPAKGLAHYTGTWRHRSKDGRILTILVRSNAVEDRGRPARLALLEDLTDRTALEAQLLQSQKMEAVGQLAGGIAHDFNNILTAIEGYATLLVESLTGDDVRRRDAEDILRAAERAAGLTRQLLAFSRKQMLDLRVVAISDVVREIMPMLKRLVSETIDVTTIAEAQGRVKADAGQLQQVLVNLVVNAADAIGSGGQITIETRDVALDETYAQGHASSDAGRHVMLAVSDTGAGMDAATQARIFEPFFTTKAVGRGTGLGLSTVYGIVKQSGGHVWVYSEVGQGTTFKVYLPITEEMPAPAPVTRPMLRTQPAHILLLEDEAGIRRVLVRILEKQGYTVHATERPADALAFAARPDAAIDLLLTDVVLPGMSGTAVAAEIQALRPACKVLYMSGYTDDAIIRHGVLDPNAAFLQKPFTGAVLIHKVQDVLAIEITGA